MGLKEFLFGEDRGVSPVIGVILMVAITVILAAVIASFVLGLGDNQQVTPTAQFSFDYEASGIYTASTAPGGGNVTITHTSGDTIPHNEIYIRGTGIADPGGDFSTNFSSAIDIHENTGDKIWPSSKASSSVGNTDAVVAGDSIDVTVHSNYELRVVWEPQEGGSSATLADDSGPDA